LALLAGGSAHAEGDIGDDAVRYTLVLHARLTAKRDYPSQDVLFDPASAGFAVDDYLVPSKKSGYGSTFLAAGLRGAALDGAIHWRIAFDSGELRSQQLNEVDQVCLATTATGLDVVGRGRCLFFPGQGIHSAPLLSTSLGNQSLTANGRPVREEFAQTLFLREAWLRWDAGPNRFLGLGAGRKRITVGDGFIYDDYGSGLELSADLGAIGPQWETGLTFFRPSRDAFKLGDGVWPMLAFRADWHPSLFEHVGAFAAGWLDQTGSVGSLFRSSDVEASVLRVQGTVGPEQTREEQLLAANLALPAARSAALVWLGTSGGLLPGRGHHLSWTGALLFGSAQVASVTPELTLGPVERVPVFGKMASLRYRLELPADFGLTGSLLYLSGTQPLEEQRREGLKERYDGFLGVAPYVTATNIFFNGGVSESFAARQATAPGVNGRGVIAPGLGLSWDPVLSVSAELKAAYLIAAVPGPFGGRIYGPEADLNLAWAPFDWLILAAEADVLVPGDFFPAGPPMVKVVVGVDIVRL
jgi:hypothetical protein